MIYQNLFLFYLKAGDFSLRKVNKASKILLEQIYRVLCFECFPDETGCAECKEKAEKAVCAECKEKAEKAVFSLISSLPEIRRLLLTDVEAAYEVTQRQKVLMR